jgi:DNA-binding CsgD family transcriptional regulator
MVVARSLNRLGNQQLNVDHPLEALAHHREALAIFQAAGERPGLAETYDLMGMASCLSGDLVSGTEYYGQAVALLRELDDRQGLVSSLASLTMSGLTYQTSTLVVAAPLAAVTQQAQAALTLARSINQRSGEAYALIFLSFCQGSAGDYDAALASALAGLGVAESIQHRQWQVAAHCALAALYWDLLVLPEAARQAQAALALAQASASRHWINCATGYLASIQVAAGQPELATATLAAATLAGALTPPGAAQTLGQRLVWAARAELALAQGQAEQAVTLVDQLCADAPNWASAGQGAIPRLAFLRATALGQLNRWPAAAAELEAARRVAAGAGARGWLWRIDRELAHTYQATGQLAEAVSRADSARALLTELAGGLADPDQRAGLEQAAASLAPAGRPATPRQRAAVAFGGLTPREREVAGLIAQGKSNREAAAALVVSERTVETHVANILGKLGLSSRTQIAAWAIERGLHTPP